MLTPRAIILATFSQRMGEMPDGGPIGVVKTYTMAVLIKSAPKLTKKNFANSTRTTAALDRKVQYLLRKKLCVITTEKAMALIKARYNPE